ncbi:MAG: hypothetical protein AB8H86_20300 [Polyangiales bacterium]
MTDESGEKMCPCGNVSVAHKNSAALNLRLDDGVARCMPCQLARRGHAFRMFAIIISLVLGIGGALSGDTYALFALGLGPLAWVLSIPYLRSAESERGPGARESEQTSQVPSKRWPC